MCLIWMRVCRRVFLAQIRLGRAKDIVLLRINIFGCGLVGDGRLVWLVG
jgi:hypothetical protein